jgi:hypothetical protein
MAWIGRFLILPSELLLATVLFAQGTTSQATAACNFDANDQVAVEYQRFSVNSKKPVFGHEIPYNKAWAPGGKPMTLFTNSAVIAGGHDIPVGAYTMFVIPSQKEWMLVISKSTDTSGRYDEQDDLIRIPMGYGQLDQPEGQFSIFFAHIAPGQCSMRLDLEKARAWVIFQKR